MQGEFRSRGMHHKLSSFTVAVTIAAFGVSLLVSLPQAHANSRVAKKIKAKNVQAMENYDLLEFEDAKQLLNEAVSLAKKNKFNGSLVARTYLNLGIVYFAGLQDAESAKLAFIDAVQLDPKIAIDPVYRTDGMVKLLKTTKKEFAGGGSAKRRPPPEEDTDDDDADVDCDRLQGIEHNLVDEAEARRVRKITAFVGYELKAKKVTLFYRSQGKVKFTEAGMDRSKGCKFIGKIPGKALRGEALHYYISAFNKRGKKVASKGSSGSPNIIEVLKPKKRNKASFTADDENPLGKRNAEKVSAPVVDDDDDDERITSVTTPGTKSPRLFVLIPIGSGAGYVTGATEQAKNAVACCVAPAFLNLSPEIGYVLKPKMAVAFAFRMGFPVGANIPGHATGAPSGLVRFRYGLEGTLDNLQLVGSVGAGLLRHTVKLSNPVMGGDTDTVASGPFLLGVGAAYWRPLGGPMKFVAEAHSYAAIPGPVKEIGDCPGEGCIEPNFALHFDLNVGVLLAF